jgi:hypothetical protein
MQSRNPHIAAQLAAGVIIRAIDLPFAPVVLCRCCKERPMLFKLATSDGHPADFASGFCRECRPHQAVDPQDAIEAEYRSRFNMPASQELVESLSRPFELQQTPIPVATRQELLEDLDGRLRELDVLKLRFAADWDDMMAGTYGGSLEGLMEASEAVSDEYNDLMEQRYALEHGC